MSVLLAAPEGIAKHNRVADDGRVAQEAGGDRDDGRRAPAMRVRHEPDLARTNILDSD